MATNEALVLDGLALNDGGVLTMESVDLTPPAPREEWISGADSEGALLARDPLHDNRVIEARIRVEPQATMNLALAKIALIIDKLQECKRNTNGLALTWVPANSTLATITFRCLSGQITNLPVAIDSGWFVNAPLLTIRLTCLPAGEGTETLINSATSSLPLVEVELVSVGGDLPAHGRLVVTDAASQARRYCAWGLESRWYPISSPPALLIDSTSLVTTGFSGTTGTRSGAYSGASNNVITSTLHTQAQAVCGLGNLSHVGSFRPQLRFWVSATTIAVRLTFQALDGPMRSLSYKVPVTVGWNHVDLGLITIAQTTLGTQRWTGRIEAYCTTPINTVFEPSGRTFEVDFVALMPAEAFGRARGTYAYQPGVLTGYDDFLGSVNLGGTTAPLGGTWATSGATTDLAGSGGEMVRSTAVAEATPRFAILGSTSYTATEVAVSVGIDQTLRLDKAMQVIARWTDSSNYAFAKLLIDVGDDNDEVLLTVGVRIAAADTILASHTGLVLPSLHPALYTLRLVVLASGRVFVTVLDSAGTVLAFIESQHTALATGGALATGKPGFSDQSTGTSVATRRYDNFYAATPPAEPIVCHSSQSIEFRHDSTLREDSTGTYAGPPPEYVGARFTVPCAGGPGRKARVAVIARRNDIETAADDNIADSTTVAVYATKRYLAVPR